MFYLGLQLIRWGPLTVKLFPDSSVGKESDCNTGDPGLIPGSARSAGEEIDYLFLHIDALQSRIEKEDKLVL